MVGEFVNMVGSFHKKAYFGLSVCFLFLLWVNAVAVAQDGSGFGVGDEVIVQGGPMTLYTQPDGGTRLTEMPEGTVTKIMAEPEIVDGIHWWYITNNYGWVSEADALGGILTPFNPATLEQTVAEASQELATEPNNANAYFRRGWAYFNQQNYEQAINDLSTAISLDTENPTLYLASGKVYLDAGQYTDAIHDLTMALTYLPDDLAARNRRGVAYQNLSDYQQAALDYSTGLQLAPDYGLLYYNLGNVARLSGNQFLALDYYDQAVAIDPNLHQVHYGRGYAHNALGDFSKALNEFEQYAVYYPDGYQVYMGLGEVYENLGEFETALDYYNQAMTIDAQNPFIYRSRGRLYYKLFRFGESQDDLARAVEYAADPGVEYNLHGVMYANLEDYPAAIDSYTRAVEAGYQNAHWAIYNRGMAHRLINEMDEALADFETALELEPNFPAPYLARGSVLIATGRHEEALENMNDAIALFPSLAPLYYQRGTIYDVRLNDPQSALSDYQQAADLNPYEPGYFAALGNLYMDMGLYDEAVTAYEQHVALVGNNHTPDTATIISRLESLRAQQTAAEENQLQPLTDAPVQDNYDTVRQVAYGWREDPSGPLALHVAKSGESSVPISPETNITHITWSPDGQRIAFSDSYGVYLIAPDGAGLTTVASASGPSNLRFSPDGTQIAYTAAGHIWVVNVDGTQNRNLTAGFGGYEYFGERGFVWTPDGEYILFTASIDSPTIPYGIFQMTSDGSEMIILLETPEEDIGVENLRVSPDGQWLSFVPISIGEPLWIANIATGEWQALEANGKIDIYDWSPDSTRIIYASREGDIYIANINAAAQQAPMTIEVGERQYLRGWTSDGQGIFLYDCVDVCQLFTMNLDGTDLTQITTDAGSKMFMVVSPAVR